MRKIIFYRLGSLARLPMMVVTDFGLTIYDGFLDILLGPTSQGSRREVRRWSKTVRRVENLERPTTKPSESSQASGRQSDKLRFGQGEVANHLAKMNRKAADSVRN